MSKARKIKKRSNGHLISVELENLKKLVPLVVEMDSLLDNLESSSVSDFEDSINAKTGFVNSMMSATAHGFDKEYTRILELEKLIEGKLSSKDLTKTKEIKPAIISEIIDKHTEFYSTTELKTKQSLENVIKEFNSLTPDERRQIGLNRSHELAFNIYSELRF